MSENPLPSSPISFEANIDWEALYHQLQSENEALRLAALKKVNQATNFLANLSLADVRAVLKSPMFWVGIGVGVILAFSYGLVPVLDMIHTRRG